MLRRLLKVEVEESSRLLYIVYLCLGLVACLTVLEVFHLLVLGCWNAEVFGAITGLIGSVVGIILGRRID